MKETIATHDDYINLMATIEKMLQKATQKGGFADLLPEEADELARLSLLAETYEDAIPVFPINPPWL